MNKPYILEDVECDNCKGNKEYLLVGCQKNGCMGKGFYPKKIYLDIETDSEGNIESMRIIENGV